MLNYVFKFRLVDIYNFRPLKCNSQNYIIKVTGNISKIKYKKIQENIWIRKFSKMIKMIV